MGTVVIMLYHILESSWERSSRHHTEGSNRVTCRRLLNRVALIVSRCKRVLNHHVRRLKHMHFLFVNDISVKLEKKINKSTKLWSRAVWVQVSIPPLRRTETTDCSLRPDSKAGHLAARGDSGIISGKPAEPALGARGLFMLS